MVVGVIILIAALFYYGIFDPLRFVSRQCNFEPGLPCTTYKLESNLSSGGATFLVQLSNNLGYDISLPTGAMLLHVENVGKPGKQTYAGNCSPSLPAVIKKGATFTCIVSIPDKEVIPSIGKIVKLQPELSYKNCLTDPHYLTTANCTNASSYTTAGTTITQMEAYSQTLYCGDGICSPSIGENIATCPADCIPGTLLLTATPQLVPPDGTNFSTITARLLDPTGKPISATVVAFASDVGTLSAPSFITDANGYATVTITSATTGIANITANALQLSNSTNVTFKYAPTTININVQTPICTGAASNITATLTDQGGSPMQGYIVKFGHSSSNANSRFTVSLAITDQNGNAASIFYNDTSIEKVKIQANVTDPSTGQLVLSSWSTPIDVGDCGAGGVGCIAPSNGDWVITTDVLCVNVTLPINGSIIIAEGASLTLRGATLNFSLPPKTLFPYQGIFVNGTFNIVEDWNGKPSVLMSNTTELDCVSGHAECIGAPAPPGSDCYIYKLPCPYGLPKFQLEIWPGANFTSNNSVIDGVGLYGHSSCGPSGQFGAYVAGDNAIIQNTEIAYASQSCITITGDNVQLINNKIHDCPQGIMLTKLFVIDPCKMGQHDYSPAPSASNAYIYGNEIYNTTTGIWIEDWNPSTPIGNNLITGNFIHNTGTGIFVQNGDSYNGIKYNNRIQSNRIISNSYGVVVQQQRYAQLSSNIIHDNSIAGVYCTPSADPNFTAVSDFSEDNIYNNLDNCSTCHVVRGHGSECPAP